jgi:phage-related protein
MIIILCTTNCWGNDGMMRQGMSRQDLMSNYSINMRRMLNDTLNSINSYQNHILESDVDDINELWFDMMEIEKKNCKRILDVLRKIDPIQGKMCKSKKLNEVQIKETIAIPPPTNSKDRAKVLSNIREDLMQQLNMINNYETMTMQTSTSEIRNLMNEIAETKRQNVEMLAKALEQLDADGYDEMQLEM